MYLPKFNFPCHGFQPNMEKSWLLRTIKWSVFYVAVVFNAQSRSLSSQILPNIPTPRKDFFLESQRNINHILKILSFLRNIFCTHCKSLYGSQSPFTIKSINDTNGTDSHKMKAGIRPFSRCSAHLRQTSQCLTSQANNNTFIHTYTYYTFECTQHIRFWKALWAIKLFLSLWLGWP